MNHEGNITNRIEFGDIGGDKFLVCDFDLAFLELGEIDETSFDGSSSSNGVDLIPGLYDVSTISSGSISHSNYVVP